MLDIPSQERLLNTAARDARLQGGSHLRHGGVEPGEGGRYRESGEEFHVSPVPTAYTNCLAQTPVAHNSLRWPKTRTVVEIILHITRFTY